jgi:murein DD-endopeptidase MepM/ murein hydrolase activator NlpD
MTSRRYTVLIADRTTGAMRRLTVGLRPTLLIAAAVYMLPVAIGVGAAWSAMSDAQELRTSNAALIVENGSYRAATGELTTQIQSLEGVIDDLGHRASIDPAQAQAMSKLPAIVRSRAMGGSDVATPPPNPAEAAPGIEAGKSPQDTFGVLKKMLQSLENRLSYVRRDVERTEALSNATPSIWPAHGWLTGTFGGRSDPFTGEPAYHTGLDISLEKGSPVFATADGRVESTSYTGDYGNLIVIQHGFGLTTRYGHLSAYRVRPGDNVKRGDVIGLVGATGRATGAHVHYEILINGKLTDPLKLLTRPVPNLATH